MLAKFLSHWKKYKNNFIFSLPPNEISIINQF